VHWRAECLDGRPIGLLWWFGVRKIVRSRCRAAAEIVPPTACWRSGGVGAVVRWTAMAFDTPVALLPLVQPARGPFGAAHRMMDFWARVPSGTRRDRAGLAATWSGSSTHRDLRLRFRL